LIWAPRPTLPGRNEKRTLSKNMKLIIKKENYKTPCGKKKIIN
jgi:hypothetical protein